MRIFTISRKGLYLGLLVFAFSFIVVSAIPWDRALPSITKHPGTYYMVNTEEKVLALTFDDGPDPLYTGHILDVLKEKDVRGTFFVLGENVQGNPELMRRIYEDGHEVANHGYSHNYSPSKFVQELSKTEEILQNMFNTRSVYYRPPGGIVSESVLKAVNEQGLTLALWSVDSKDWQNPGSERIAQTVIKNSFPGAIVLLHDGGEKREQTIRALPVIIDQLKREGYRFVTLSELKNYERTAPVKGPNLHK